MAGRGEEKGRADSQAQYQPTQTGKKRGTRIRDAEEAGRTKQTSTGTRAGRAARPNSDDRRRCRTGLTPRRAADRSSGCQPEAARLGLGSPGRLTSSLEPDLPGDAVDENRALAAARGGVGGIKPRARDAAVLHLVRGRRCRAPSNGALDVGVVSPRSRDPLASG